MGFVNPASPGWGLAWVCLGTVCGVVPLVSAVCGVRGWGSVSACLWDVCGFVGAPLAPRRFRFRRAVWACVLGPGLGCAQPFLAGLSRCVFCAFFFPVPGLVVPVPPSPFFWAGLVALLFFFACFGVPFPGGPLFLAWCCRFWVGGPPVPLWGSCLRCLLGGGLAASGGVGGWFGGCGLFWRLFPLPPPFFWGGGGLPVPPSAFAGLVHALACFQCCLPGCCFQLRSVWPRAGPMGRVGYVHGGLGAPSCRVRSWLCRLGGCARRLLVLFSVRGLGLFVSFPLCSAGFNLLGGPPLLSPGALWPRVWPAVLVYGVLARRLPGCAVAGFG